MGVYKAVAQFAFVYANQAEADYRIFMGAVRKGQLKTIEGVT